MRWRKLLIGLAVVAAIIATIFALLPREPKYEGRTLSEWIKEANPRHSANYKQRKDYEAVRHIGTNALPWLLKWIALKDPPAWRLRLLGASQQLPQWMQTRLVPFVLGNGSNDQYRQMAVDGFMMLGPDASLAVTDLLKIMNTAPDALAVSEVLDRIGKAAIKPTIGVLTNQSNSFPIRIAAAEWLFHYDPQVEQKTITSLMATCLRQGQTNLAPNAVEILASYRCEPDLVVPHLINRLRDPNVDVRFQAAKHLGRYHAAAAAAVPALAEALNDSYPWVQEMAEDALVQVDPRALEKFAPAKAETRRKWEWRSTQSRSNLMTQ